MTDTKPSLVLYSSWPFSTAWIPDTRGLVVSVVVAGGRPQNLACFNS